MKKNTLTKRNQLPAFFWILGCPALTRTSRSTWLKDKSPRERPDVIAANNTNAEHMLSKIQK